MEKELQKELHKLIRSPKKKKQHTKWGHFNSILLNEFKKGKLIVEFKDTCVQNDYKKIFLKLTLPNFEVDLNFKYYYVDYIDFTENLIIIPQFTNNFDKIEHKLGYYKLVNLYDLFEIDIPKVTLNI